jgi:hypothetical protein
MVVNCSAWLTISKRILCTAYPMSGRTLPSAKLHYQLDFKTYKNQVFLKENSTMKLNS